MNNLDWEPEPLQDWEPEYEPDWEPGIADHLPTNWAWLGRMRKEAQAARMARAEPPKCGPTGFTRGVYNPELAEPPWGFEGNLVPELEEESLSNCLGTPAIIQATYQVEVALNYFRSTADRAGLLEAKPYLSRLKKIAGVLVKDATRIERRKFESGLFD